MPAAVNPDQFLHYVIAEDRLGKSVSSVRRRRCFPEGSFTPDQNGDESEDLPRSSQTFEARGQASVKAFQ